MKIIAGNWKMNGSLAMLRDMYAAIADVKTNNIVVLCPPFTLLNVRHMDGVECPKHLIIGAQDISEHDGGTFTGDISAKMVAESGAKYVIVGHSERRANHGETSELVAKKAVKAIENKLMPIICVGENAAQRESGSAFDVVGEMVRKSIPNIDSEIIVAYEPVWAISAGKIETGKNDRTATTRDIAEMHVFIADILKEIGRAGTKILYGGSVKGSNAAEIMAIPNVDGALVGGASLKASDFVATVLAADIN